MADKLCRNCGRYVPAEQGHSPRRADGQRRFQCLRCKARVEARRR